MKPNNTDSWQILKEQAKRIKNNQDFNQANRTLLLDFDGLKVDFTNQIFDERVLANLVALAEETHLAKAIADLVAGEQVNNSEKQSALHIGLRHSEVARETGQYDSVFDQFEKMVEVERSISEGNRRGFTQKPFTDIVQIGIGGSHLGSKFLVEALQEHRTGQIRIHFISNVDPNNFLETTKKLNPETTLFIVVSKSFKTIETAVNFRSVKSWFSERTNKSQDFHKHVIAVTENVEAAKILGIRKNSIFKIPRAVGGRYSVWSATSLAAIIYLGSNTFHRFLNGAAKADQHFIDEKNKIKNIPIVSALFSIWNRNFLGSHSHALLVYNDKLKSLVDYIQQLEMESNGKSHSNENETLNYSTSPIIWGGVGTNGQHSYHQLLHQGTNAFSANFYLVADQGEELLEHQEWLIANALAQAKVLKHGNKVQEQSLNYKSLIGNHPSSTILLDKITPETIGALLAVHEHKVFCEGALWHINSFDQWGVEHGKNIAQAIHAKIVTSRGESHSSFYDSYGEFI